VANAVGILQAMDNTNRVSGVVNDALVFNTDGQAVIVSGSPVLQNNFTVCFWTMPNATHSTYTESTASQGTLTGKRYLIQPLDGSTISSTARGVGISVGLNGISVVEYGFNYQAVILEWLSAPINLSASWSHVCVSFDIGLPTLYVNAVPVRQGLQTVNTAYFAVTNIGGANQFYKGYVDELRVFAARLTQVGVSQLYQSDLLASTFIVPAFNW
jgi:hypothetical protein